jgi:hypothetical protein
VAVICEREFLAQPAHVRRGRHQLDHRLAPPLLLIFGQWLGHSRARYNGR